LGRAISDVYIFKFDIYTFDNLEFDRNATPHVEVQNLE
jgi:hypothetical protein